MESQFGSRSKVVAKGKANVETAAAPQVTPQAAPQVAPTNDTGGIEGMLRSLLSEFLGDRGNPTLPAAPSVTTTELGPTIDTLAVQDAQEQAAIRSASGITESLGRPTGTAMTEVNEFTTTPEGDSGAGVTVGVGDAMIVRNPTQGLTSAPVQDTVSEVDTGTAEALEVDTTFATITKNGTSTTVEQTVPLTEGFDSLTLAEGTNIHLDGRGFVTLPHGIVPDANSIKKADGTAFDPTGRHGLRAGSLSSVDYSAATKFGISRTDYTDDEAWAKAVYAEFGDRTAGSYGTGFSDLTDRAKQAAYDMTWNAGIGAASWSSVQTMLTEASKEDDNTKSTDNLIGFTTNFKSGTEKVDGVTTKNYPRGLLKRRAQTYNLVAKTGEEASTITTESVMTNGERTGTKYDIKKDGGTVLKSWTKPDLNERLGDLEVN